MSKRILQHKTCSVDGCEKPAKARGWCSAHYERARRSGDPGGPIIRRHSCEVEGCGEKHFAKGYCADHYSLFKRNGDPLKRLRSRRGAKLEWLRSNAGHKGADCLTFPFPLGRNGYGIVTLNGTSHRAANAMCRIAHGEPPTEKHECAHSCGNGAQGCVNPQHLRWATSKENTADSIAAGTLANGERHGQSLLTRKEVIEIRKSNDKPIALAERFGVSWGTIYDIKSGRTWAWLNEL